MKRLDQLTFTRFIAIMVVLFFHTGMSAYFQKLNVFPLNSLLTSATTSVTYLYVLSGFVMALAHYRPDEKFSFSAYWSARFIRIYPLYFLSFLLICYYYLDGIADVKLRKTMLNLLALQAWWPNYAQSFNFPSWSITVEFFFYAAFPLFAFWAVRQSTKKLIWGSLAFWAFTQTIHNTLWIGYFPEYDNFLIYFPLFHLNSFILGATGGIWFLREGQKQEINPRTNLLLLAVSILLTSAYVIMSARITQIPREGQLMTGFLAPFLTLSIITLALDRSRLSNLLKYPLLINLGEISYALYILHIPIKWIYERALETQNYQSAFEYTYLPLMIATGFVAHFYIDQSIRNWLKKIMTRISAPLLLLDLIILSASIYFSFRIRFGTGREYDSYYSTILLMYWASFFLRTICAVTFNGLDPSNLHNGFARFFRPVFISVTAGSIGVAISAYAGYSLGWFENFPRSVFIIDWAITLTLSLLVRYLFKQAGVYAPKQIKE